MTEHQFNIIKAAWYNLNTRVNNKNYHARHRYKGKKIGFKNVYELAEHIGPRPSKKHQLDRINNSKGYIKNNVRWCTCKANMRNRDCSKVIWYNGNKITAHKASELSGLSLSSIYRMIDKGYL